MRSSLIKTFNEKRGMKAENPNYKMPVSAGANSSNSTASSDLCLYDSTLFYSWDTLANAWENVLREIYTYDALYHKIGVFTKSWTGTVWQEIKGAYTYDSNHNFTSQLYQEWNNNTWTNMSQDFFTYDANNNQTGALYQDGNGSAWVNYAQYFNSYDSNNNLTSSLIQGWNGSAWENSSLSSYTYNTNNNETSLLVQTWNGSAWVNYVQYITTYNLNNQITSEVGQDWDISNSAWVNNTNSIFITYDANDNITGGTMQTWNGSAWVNYSKNIITYNSNNIETSYQTQFWNGTAYVTDRQDTVTFCSNNICVASNVSQNLNPLNSSLRNYAKTDNFGCITVTSMDDVSNNNESVTIYPNPGNGIFTIQSSEFGTRNLEIYNMVGQVIYKTTIKNSQSKIDLSSQPKGIYFIRVISENKDAISNKKIIIQ